ncbi:MAG: phosphodiester glycosidase family protein [Tissierellia bacterium]|nr:phosphodiester glycosidase family protein [Tissierellia bacterium]
MKRLRKFITFILAFIIILSFKSVYADEVKINIPKTIHEDKKIEHIGPGLVHEEILRFTTNGWYNINVLRYNTLDELSTIRAYKGDEGISQRKTVSSILESNDLIAAVNGDYFHYNPVSTLGIMANDGKLEISPADPDYKTPSFFFGKTAGVGYFDRDIKIYNHRIKKDIFVNSYNKISSPYSTIAILDSNWGKNSLGSSKSKKNVEVLVVENTVKDIRRGGKPFELNENNYVLSSASDKLDEFQIGDRVDLKINLPGLENLKFAIGGGSIIVKDGKLTLTDINSKGNNPRTGIGANEDGSEIILVTIDGRSNNYTGVSQELFAHIMRELGAYNALNLDGGGSTTMAIRQKGEKDTQIVNNPSGKKERPVVNAVGIKSNAPIEELSYLKLSANKDALFPGLGTPISVSAYDKYHNRLNIENLNISMSLTGVLGDVSTKYFTPQSSGKAEIIASVGDISASTTVNVFNEAIELNCNKDRINLASGQSVELKDFYAKDENGNKVYIPQDKISFEIIGDIGHMEGSKFVANNTSASGGILCHYLNAIDVIGVSVGTEKLELDILEKDLNISNSTYPEGVGANSDFKDEKVMGENSVALNYSFPSIEKGNRAAYLNLNADSNGVYLGRTNVIGLNVKGDGKGALLKAVLVDKNNKEHSIVLANSLDFTEWKYIEAKIPNSINGELRLKRIYIAETDAEKNYSGEILLDGICVLKPREIDYEILPKKTYAHDHLIYLKDEVLPFSIGIYPTNLDKYCGYEASKKLAESFNQSSDVLILNKTTDKFFDSINIKKAKMGNGFSSGIVGGVKYINIYANSKGIRSANTETWFKLIKELENFEGKNLIITLPTPIHSMSDKRETDLLMRFLNEKAQAGVNLFVIAASNRNHVELLDSIRYIELKTNVSNEWDIKNISKVNFYLSDENLSYIIDKPYNE